MSTFLLRDRSWDKGRGPNELNSSFLHLEAVFSTSQAEPLSFKHQLPLPQEALLPEERSARMKSKGRGLLKEWGRLGHGYRPFHETQLLTCVKERKCQAAGRDVYPLIPGPQCCRRECFSAIYPGPVRASGLGPGSLTGMDSSGTNHRKPSMCCAGALTPKVLCVCLAGSWKLACVCKRSLRKTKAPGKHLSKPRKQPISLHYEVLARAW